MDLMIIPLIVFIIVFSILVIPFRVSMQLIKDGSVVQWFYRIVWLKITLLKGGLSPEDEEPEPEMEEKAIEEKKPEDEKESGDEDLMHLLGNASVIMDSLPAFIKVLRDLTRSVSIEGLSLRMIFGLRDPADTAFICGCLWSLASLTGISGARIMVEPVFDKERLDLSIKADIKIGLLWALAAVVGSVKDARIRRLITEILKERTSDARKSS